MRLNLSISYVFYLFHRKVSFFYIMCYNNVAIISVIVKISLYIIYHDYLLKQDFGIKKFIKIRYRYNETI